MVNIIPLFWGVDGLLLPVALVDFAVLLRLRMFSFLGAPSDLRGAVGSRVKSRS